MPLPVCYTLFGHIIVMRPFLNHSKEEEIDTVVDRSGGVSSSETLGGWIMSTHTGSAVQKKAESNTGCEIVHVVYTHYRRVYTTGRQ